MTQAQLRRDLTHALDAAAWAKDVLRFDADEQQRQLLRTRAKRVLLNCHRQWGKSTTVAARVAHAMLYRAPFFAVTINPSGRQSAELGRKLDDALRRAGVEPKGDGDNPISSLLPNGSRFVGLPDVEGRIRGFSAVNLLIFDEASRVQDEVQKGARPFIAAVDGDIWELSTPFGKRGFFAEHALSGDRRWLRITAPASVSGRFSAEYLEEERASLGEWWFKQEYECQFVDVTDSVFSHDLAMQSISAEVEPLFV